MAAKPKTPGPEPERLKLSPTGGWKEAVAKALAKKRPEGGWPQPAPRRKARKRPAK